MSKVRSKDTKPEEIVRKYLFSKGFRYRKNVKSLPGTPDIVLPKYKTVIFVNGCFWHGHDCSKGKLPETNREKWQEKIATNKKRDEKNYFLLREKHWKVIIIWECQLKNKKTAQESLNNLVNNIISIER